MSNSGFGVVSGLNHIAPRDGIPPGPQLAQPGGFTANLLGLEGAIQGNEAAIAPKKNRNIRRDSRRPSLVDRSRSSGILL